MDALIESLYSSSPLKKQNSWFAQYWPLVIVITFMLTLFSGAFRSARKDFRAGTIDPLLLLYLGMTTFLLAPFLHIFHFLPAYLDIIVFGTAANYYERFLSALDLLTAFFGFAHFLCLVLFIPGGGRLAKGWLVCLVLMKLLPLIDFLLAMLEIAYAPGLENLDASLLIRTECLTVLPVLVYALAWNKYFSWRAEKIRATLQEGAGKPERDDWGNQRQNRGADSKAETGRTPKRASADAQTSPSIPTVISPGRGAPRKPGEPAVRRR